MATFTYYVNIDASGANDGSSEANGFETINAMNVALNGNTYSSGDHITIYFKNPATPSTSAAAINLTSVPLGAFVVFEGYGTTPGDGLNTPGNWFHNDAYITVANHGGGQRNSVLRYFWVENAVATSGGAIGGLNTHLFQCYGYNTYASGGCSVSDGSMVQCIGEQASASATGNPTRAAINVNRGIITDCVGIGAASLSTGYRASYLQRSLILPKRTGTRETLDVGVYVADGANTAGMAIEGCTIYGFNNDGIYLEEVDSTPGANSQQISGNVIYNCGGYAINSADGTGTGLEWFGHIVANYYGACTSGFGAGLFSGYSAGNTLLTADPFTNAAGFDFSINDAAGGGAAIKSGALQDWSGVLASDPQTLAGWWQRAGGGGSAAPVIY